MPPLLPHLTATVLKDCLQQVLTPVHHVCISKKLQGILKGKKTQFEGTEQASEPDSDRAEMLELSDQEFLKMMMNIPGVLMEKCRQKCVQ